MWLLEKCARYDHGAGVRHAHAVTTGRYDDEPACRQVAMHFSGPLDRCDCIEFPGEQQDRFLRDDTLPEAGRDIARLPDTAGSRRRLLLQLAAP